MDTIACAGSETVSGLWIGYIMRVKNSANSIVQVSHTMHRQGLTQVTSKRKSASKKVVSKY